ncbi:substrate-binding domain-containing protein [Paenibacillus sp. JX-17]|uniref:Substrate-binding domain-containing protein n=1 Tax=Paenibacillus lacisoli TaxID=3064525 RepID=A0ABT9CLP5_9BACL|nr:substrate-binding domain-containing protein [Paenibacillus sp. JX-17]MDO7908847.1 substrate-binding domain-containing protein [Paenibacillus sp. JX-17]
MSRGRLRGPANYEQLNDNNQTGRIAIHDYRPMNVFTYLGCTILFGVIYAAFNVIWGFIAASRAQDLLNQMWVSDVGLICMLVLYLYVTLGFFYWTGRRVIHDLEVSPRGLCLCLLPFLLLECAVWSAGILHGKGDGGVWSAAWTLHTLLNYWSYPLTSSVQFYILNMSAVYLVTSLMPMAAVILGVYSLETRSRWRKWLPVIPGMAAVIIVFTFIAAFIPHSSTLSAGRYPKIDGATAAIPFAQSLIREVTGVNKAGAVQQVDFHTTHQAYLNLIHGKVDMIFAAQPSDQELELAAQQGVKLKLIPIGKDAFVFLVHRSNPVDNLSTRQIQRIYEGYIANWKEVGGEDQWIAALQREENSGSQTYMEKRVMSDLAMVKAEPQMQINFMGGLIDTVAAFYRDHNAMGYSFNYYAKEMHRRPEVKVLTIDGVVPDHATIRSGKYPFTAELYAVIREGEEDSSESSRLIRWLTGPEGTRLVESTGFVPVHSGEDEFR